MERMGLLVVLLCCLASASGFTAPSLLPTPLRAPRGRSGLVSTRASMKPDDKWNFSRFAQTFTTFNGLPFLGPLGRAATVPRPESAGDSARNKVMFDFGSLAPQEFNKIWAPLDDVVMGGLSVSRVVLTPEGNAKLEGTTSAGNNGGFCSARTRNVNPPFDISSYTGVGVRVRSDTKTRYKLILRDTNDWDAVAWCHSFDLPAQKWVDLKVPFSSFVPVVRGRRVSTRNINPSSIYSVQIMLSKYEYDGELNPLFSEGAFELQFGPIGAYK